MQMINGTVVKFLALVFLSVAGCGGGTITAQAPDTGTPKDDPTATTSVNDSAPAVGGDRMPPP